MRFIYYARTRVGVCPYNHRSERILGVTEHVCSECGIVYDENDVEIVDWDFIPILGEGK